MELKDIITDIYRVINQASDAKRDLMRASQEDMYEYMYLADQVDMLKNEISDADYSLDKIKDELYALADELETAVFNQEMAVLSPFKKEGN
jgi:predicted nuclease with TOPRIM domain